MRNLIKKHIYYWFLFLGIFCAACSKVPRDILSEKKMQAVQVDMQLAESMISMKSREYKEPEQKAALYQAVFRKHGITEAQYDSSLVWYGKNLDIYMKVYDRMIADLNKKQKELGDIQASAAPVTKQDSVDIWPRRDYLTLMPDALFNGVLFDVSPESSYPSGSTFVFGMDVWGINKQMRYYPEVRLFADQGDTIVSVSEKVLRDGHFQTVLQTLPTKQVKRVFGQIFMNNADSASYYKIYLDEIELMRYNYGRWDEIRQNNDIHQQKDQAPAL